MKKYGKALAMILTAAVVCSVSTTVSWADEDDWGDWEDWDDEAYDYWGDYTYGSWGYGGGGTINENYTDTYQPTPGTPCPPQTEQSEYALTARLLRVIAYSGTVIRSAPQADGEAIAQGDYGQIFYLLDDSAPDWYKVRYDGREGYIGKTSGARVETSIKMQPGLDIRARVVDHGLQYLGSKYTFGGQNAESGFDCSSFARTVMGAAGVSLGASTRDQVKQGTTIDITQIKPGDLIFYGASEETVNHVGIYIGNGHILQAEGTGIGITVRPWNGRSDVFRVASFLAE